MKCPARWLGGANRHPLVIQQGVFHPIDYLLWRRLIHGEVKTTIWKLPEVSVIDHVLPQSGLKIYPLPIKWTAWLALLTAT